MAGIFGGRWRAMLAFQQRGKGLEGGDYSSLQAIFPPLHTSKPRFPAAGAPRSGEAAGPREGKLAGASRASHPAPPAARAHCKQGRLLCFRNSCLLFKKKKRQGLQCSSLLSPSRPLPVLLKGALSFDSPIPGASQNPLHLGASRQPTSAGRKTGRRPGLSR